MRRPDKIQRKGGISYQIRFRDQHDKMRYETFATRKLADKRLREIEEQRDAGTLISTKMGLDALAAEWRTAHLDGWRTSTVNDYDEATARLVGYFGNRQLRSITPGDIEEFRRQELATIRANLQAQLERRKQPLDRAATAGVRSVNKAVATLRAMLKFAQGRRYLTFNAAEHVRKLKPEARKDQPLDANVLSPPELQKLIEHVPADWRAAFMVLGYGGLRLGEMLGLAWDDCDFASNRLRVQRQLEASTGELREPKTRAGTRLVEVPSFVMHELKVWKLRCPKGELGLCFPTRSDDPERCGNPFNQDNFRHRVFRPALRRAGLRRVRVHDLRHGAASMLIATGADLATISRQLGHANIAITLSTYAHQFARRNETGLGAKLEAMLTKEGGCESAAFSNSAG